jgi:hypothetical protein
MSYEMFTESGDNLVTDLVKMAKTYGLSATVVLGMMAAISRDECFGEITDTAVREAVGIQLGWYE